MDIISTDAAVQQVYEHHQLSSPTSKPLHSPQSNETHSLLSSSSSSTRTSQHLRRNNMSRNHSRLSRLSHLSILLITLFATSLPLPTVAKYRLIPSRRTNANHKRQATAANNTKKNNRNKGNTQIILKPKKKLEAISLKLDATVSTNEQGQKVLLLSPESTQAVESAMQSSLNVDSDIVSSQKMEASQPKQKMAVEVEQHPQQASSSGGGSTSSTSTSTSSTGTSSKEQKVLFYDPDELKTSPGEPPLPKKVYDENGNEVDMAGKEALLVKPHPPPPENGVKDKNDNWKTNKTSTILQTTQTQDQAIILMTVATMALLVGALSARRMRSRQFLSFCIENESLEDELAYDAAYTTQSTVGASSFYAGGGYDTFASGKYGGDLRWRGDLEKFDV